MKKLLYLALWNVVGDIEACGVSQKIFTQAKAFAQLGYQTDVVMRSGSDFLLFHFPHGESENWKMDSSRIWPQRKFFYKDAVNKLNLGTYDGFYIRYQLCDYYFLKLLRQIKKLQKKAAKIVVEIPTYPYADVCKESLKKQVLYFQDQLFACCLKRYINRFVIYTEQSKIYGIPAICTQNGIDVDTYQVRSKIVPVPGVIRLIAIANTTPSHGYDRLIEGIALYKKENPDGWNFKFYIVGEGTQIPFYKEQVKREGLEETVIFVGRKPKGELYKYVEEADIGVDSLAAFRVHLETTSSLKSREYLCYGLPFITASKVTGIDENLQWIIRMPNDETPLNMNEIIEFYTKIEKYGSVRVAEELHKYAKEHVDAIQTLRCVTEYLDS